MSVKFSIPSRMEGIQGAEPEFYKPGELITEPAASGRLQILVVMGSALSLLGYIPIAVELFVKDGVSLEMTTILAYSLGLTSGGFFLAYGILARSTAVIITSSLVIAISLFIFLTIIMFSLRDPPARSSHLPLK
jgi:hypothetical protein